MHFDIITVVWGEAYLDLFTRLVLATLPPGGPAAFQVLKWLLPLQNSDSAIVRGLYRGLVWPLRLADRLVRPALLWHRRRRRPACSAPGDAR